MTKIKNNQCFVAIRCLVYNHEPYLRECLDGFIKQQTNFKFVAIVHDDASTDKSADIIREYEEKYPDIIKPIYETENQYSKQNGSLGQIVNTAIKATGAKYTALCEGDDYWTDPFKLQKQVDFLETNPRYSFCCHRFNILQECTKTFLKDYAHTYYTKDQNLIITEDVFFSTWATQLLTTLLKTDRFIEACDTSRQLFGKALDVYLYFLLLQSGPGISLNENMGVYRWHENGASIGRSDSQKIKDGYIVSINLYNNFPQNTILKSRVKYYGMRYLGFCSCWKKQDIDFYRKNTSLWETSKECLIATIIFMLPPTIWRFLRKSYRSFILKN